MKFAIALVAVLGVASAQQLGVTPENRALPSPSPLPILNRAVLENEARASILRYINDISPDGSYVYGFETDNGIAVQAEGVPRNFGGNPPLIPIVSQGAFSYTSPEGIPIGLAYTADENGFHPSGDSIPTPPPIPEYILRSLEFNARNAPPPTQVNSIQKQ